MISRFQVVVLCALFVGCSNDDYDILVTVRDPLAIADAAASLHVGESLDALQSRSLADLQFSVTIPVTNAGQIAERIFWAEARNSDDIPLARGFVMLDFEAGDDRAEISLGAVCDAQQRCPAPAETSICCVGANVCVDTLDACPPLSQPKLPGFALAFNPGNRVLIPSFNVAPENPNNDGLTLEAWIRVTDCPLAECRGAFLSKGGDFALRLTSRGGRNTLETRIANEASNRSSPDAASNFGGDWQHTAVTYDGQQVRLYVDAIQVAFGPLSGPLATGTDSIVMGHQELALEVGEVRIWRYARSPAQLASTMNQRLSGEEEGLEAYYALDEGEGQSASDSSGQGHGGILGSGADADADDPTWIARDL